MANTCDIARILSDIHSLQSAYNAAYSMNIPASLVATAKDSLQDFISNDKVLSGENVTFDAEALARLDRIDKTTAEVLDRIDHDVELRGLPLDQHHKLIAPMAKAQMIAKGIKETASRCTLFKVPLEFSSFI